MLTLEMSGGTPAFAQQRGGFLSGLFGNNQNTRNQQAANTAQRRSNAAVQLALNFFEFDAGRVDGILGQKSRAAISAFQGFMGYEPTGALTRDERTTLTSAYRAFDRDDEAIALKISLGLFSVQDWLKARANGADVAQEEAENLAPAGPLSMQSTCIDIGASGPQDLIKAQFCNLRHLAIGHGDYLLETSINTSSITPVVGECQNLTHSIEAQLALVTTASSRDIISDMDLWFRRSGTSVEKITRQAQTCLGVAYSHDDAEAALAPLLILSGLKDPIYTELTGYHIALGFAPDGAQNAAQARAWMEAAIVAHTEAEASLTAQSSQRRIDILVNIIRLLAVQD